MSIKSVRSAVRLSLHLKQYAMHCFFSEALQQSHLLKNMGHNRQPSDSSVDRFMAKEEAVESGDNENKVRHILTLNLGF